MASYSENLITIRDQLQTRIIEITSKLRPNTNIDGESHDWTGKLKELQDQVTAINAAIAADNPQEVVSYGETWYC